jgi:hypothetical protein
MKTKPLAAIGLLLNVASMQPDRGDHLYGADIILRLGFRYLGWWAICTMAETSKPFDSII